MPKQNSTKKSDIKELYNTLMYFIEPELMTDMLPILDSIYKDEPPENKKIRLDWYKEAFEIFAEKYSSFMGIWKHELAHIKQKAQGMKEVSDQASEKNSLSSIEQSIDKL